MYVFPRDSLVVHCLGLYALIAFKHGGFLVRELKSSLVAWPIYMYLSLIYLCIFEERDMFFLSCLFTDVSLGLTKP